MIPLSSVKGDELQLFLMSDVVSDETMMIDTLDGYLSAVASGPTTVIMDA